jgi:hypothetical protein
MHEYKFNTGNRVKLANDENSPTFVVLETAEDAWGDGWRGEAAYRVVNFSEDVWEPETMYETCLLNEWDHHLKWHAPKIRTWPSGFTGIEDSTESMTCLAENMRIHHAQPFTEVLDYLDGAVGGFDNVSVLNVADRAIRIEVEVPASSWMTWLLEFDDSGRLTDILHAKEWRSTDYQDLQRRQCRIRALVLKREVNILVQDAAELTGTDGLALHRVACAVDSALPAIMALGRHDTSSYPAEKVQRVVEYAKIAHDGLKGIK